MRPQTPFLFIACVAALVACQPDASDETDVAENNVEPVDVAVQTLRPGLWELRESVGNVADARMRGVDAAEIEDDPANRGASRTICLPPQLADRPPPEFWAGSANACDYDRIAMIDGRLDATISCNATPGTMTITIAGDYAPGGFDVAMTTARRGTGPDDVTVNGRLVGEWHGECEAEDVENEAG